MSFLDRLSKGRDNSSADSTSNITSDSSSTKEPVSETDTKNSSADNIPKTADTADSNNSADSSAVSDIRQNNMMSFQRNSPLQFGEICISLDYLTKDDVMKILDIQKESHNRFGEIAVNENFLTDEEISKVLDIQKSARSVKGGLDVGNGDYINLDNIQPEFFGPFAPFIYDDSITDIDYNGKDLWTTSDNGQRIKRSIDISREFLMQFTSKVANSVNRQFNKTHPSLEAEAKTGQNISLRISVLSEDAAVTGRTINIRKTPMFSKINIEESLKNGYFSKEMASFLCNAVRAHLNIVICGEPGTGKTELSKFISMRIPDYERVITIEDNLEWHYEEMCPSADCTAIKVYDDFSTSQAIKHCLRSGPQWLMVAEIRDVDAYDFIKGLSTGVNGITSLHTDDAHRIPERIVNMTHDPALLNDVYDFVDVGVLVDRNFFEKGRAQRYVSQVSVFDNDDDNNVCVDVFNFRKKVDSVIPKRIVQKFHKFGIEDPFYDKEIYDAAEKIKNLAEDNASDNHFVAEENDASDDSYDQDSQSVQNDINTDSSVDFSRLKFDSFAD